MIKTERDEFAKALATFYSTWSREQPAVDIWFHALRDFDLPTIRRAMLDYTKTGKRTPFPANIAELCSIGKSHPSDQKSVGELVRQLPIGPNPGWEVMCRRLIQDHGLEKAAELWEESYPGHGRQYVFGLV